MQGVVRYPARGWFVGQVSLNASGSFALTGELVWCKPAQAVATGLYPAGFLARHSLNGFRWTAPAAGQLPAPLTNGGTLFVNLGGTNQTWNPSLPARIAVTSPSPDPLNVRITLNARNGLFTGSYLAGDGRRYPISGTLLPISTFLGKGIGLMVKPDSVGSVQF
jgi:hypothetical protein